MPPWAAFIAGMGLALSIGAILVKLGMWGGSHEGDIRRLDEEIRRLRDWRHKVGEDPCDSVLRLYNLMEKDIDELRKKVFNGHHRP